MRIEERDREYIIMMVEYCERIEAATVRFGNSYESFEKDNDYQDVINMNIFQIGELSNQLSDELKESMPDIPWHQLYGIRNILAHAYISIENKVIWDTVQNDIPKLKEKLQNKA